MAKVSRISANGEDRLSSLPDKAITHILTITISKRWKKLYAFLPSLNFSLRDILNTSSRSEFAKYQKIVGLALYRHNGDIESIDMEVHDVQTMHSWLTSISFRASVNLRHVKVTLHEAIQSEEYTPPLVFRLCPNLTSFSFSFGGQYRKYPFSFPLTLSGFRSLTSCTFSEIKLHKGKWVQTLLSSTHSMQHLNFTMCDIVSSFRVSSQTLKTLALDHVWSSSDDEEGVCISVECPNLDSISMPSSFFDKIEGVSACRAFNLHMVPDTYPTLWKKMTIMDKVENFDSLSLTFENQGKDDNSDDHASPKECDKKYIKKLKEELKSVMEGYCFNPLRKLRQLRIVGPFKLERWFLCQVIIMCPRLTMLHISLTRYESQYEEYTQFLQEPSISKIRKPSTAILLEDLHDD